MYICTKCNDNFKFTISLKLNGVKTFLAVPPNAVCFRLLVFFTVDRKSSQTKTFYKNMIYMFFLYHFSVKCIRKKNYLPLYGRLKGIVRD